jgi:hypothetical protein
MKDSDPFGLSGHMPGQYEISVCKLDIEFKKRIKEMMWL